MTAIVIKLPVGLGFDPAAVTDPSLREVIESKSAWTLWLAWRQSHIVCQEFNAQCVRAGRMIDDEKPESPQDLARILYRFGGPYSNFGFSDVDRFVPEAIGFFTGAKEMTWEVVKP